MYRFIQRRFQSTIFSLSSGHGKCGVAVVRVSGPRTRTALQEMVGGELKPRYAHYKNIHTPHSKELLDKGLVLWFPGPHSFTGEDCCEFQVHGGSAVIRALLDSLGSVEGLRPAQPGEFTRRAFYSGKLDLTEVDGLADLIHAETEMQRKQALLQANGSLALLYSRWRQELLRSCAHFEAFIDFGEDENIEHDVLAQVSSNVAKVVDEMRRHLSKECGERLRTGVRTVILGEPNAGKSSFLNLLSQRSVAIISDIPGTTRDVIETSLNIGGYPVVLMDTAGLRHSTQDQVEQEGIRRARKVAENADLIIVIVNGDAVLAHWHRISELGRRTATVMTHFMDDYVRRLGIDGLDAKPKVIAINKVDLFDGDLIKSVQNCNRSGDLVVGGGGGGSGSSRDGVALLSCTTSFGLSDVISQIEAQLDSICGGQPTAESPHLSQSRYRFLLTECLEHLEKFLINLNRINGDDDNDTFIDLAITASHLQAAVRCLGKISGHVSVDDILDVIFKEFCIGK